MATGDYEADCNYLLYGKYTHRVSPLDKLRQHLYQDADEWDKHNVPILYIDEEMENRVKLFEEFYEIRLPDEIYEIFALPDIQDRIRQYLYHDVNLPPTSELEDITVDIDTWVPMPQPPDDMDFAFMIACDARKHYCVVIAWKYDWTKTGMIYGCKYTDYKKFMNSCNQESEISSCETGDANIKEEQTEQKEQQPEVTQDCTKRRRRRKRKTTQSPKEDPDDGFLPASKFNHSHKKYKSNKMPTMKRLVDSHGKKLTFTTFLLSLVPKE